MLLRHAHTLAQARSFLAALADEASDDDASSAYEHVLIDLDRIHCDECPDVYLDAAHPRPRHPATTSRPPRSRNSSTHGVDPLSVELILGCSTTPTTMDCT